MRRAVGPAAAMYGLFILFGIVIAAFFPFFALFLKERGLTPERIGAVLAAMAGARIVATPVWGHLADTRFGRRTILQAGTVLSAGGALLLFFAGRGFLALIVWSALFAGVGGAMGPNVDAMALVHLGDERLHGYGRIRAWESLSYAAATLGLGFLLARTGVEWMLPVYAAASLSILLWSFTFRGEPGRPAEGHGRLGAVGAVWRESPRYRRYLASMFFVWVGFSAAWNFITLRIEDQGGNPRVVGLGLAIGGLSEVPVMLLSARAVRRFGLRNVYVAGACVYATGFLVWGLITSPTLLALSSVFEGMGFGLLFTSGVVIVGKLVRPEFASTGQSMAGTVGFGIAPIVGAYGGGFLYGHFGSVTLYAAASAIAFAGAILASLALATPALTERVALEAVERGAPPPVV